MLNLLILFICINLIYTDQWYSKSQCTQKEFANHMDINCNTNEFILIGWSHYGTKKDNFNSSSKCQPSENDCIMDYTHKIAELCNGISKCEVILTQQYIHKCSDEATYLFISYQCIQNSTMLDICSQRSLTTSNSLNLISPMFPNEYPNNINCTCTIESNAIIDVENLSFNLQDNDKLLSLSGTLPFGISFLTSKNSLQLNFQTDESLSQSGFWLRLNSYQKCYLNEFKLGSKCLKIFYEKQTYKYAENKCLTMNSNLIYINDIIQEKKLQYFLLNNTQQELNSFWILNEKEKLNKNLSWWPWRSSNSSDKCVIHTQDGWIKRPCNEEYTFICERDLKQQSVPLTIRCGNIQSRINPSTQIITKTTMTTMTTAVMITTTATHISTTEQISSTMINKLQKPKTIDPNIIAAILSGISLIIFSINIIICYLCKRRTQITSSSKCKPSNNSNSSFTHEELQHSLMQHLYHEQTNTISSTSTSSKSNDTSTTTSSNLFQLSSPSTLCFPTDHIDYHVYETIPTENSTYNPTVFKPINQSNTQTLRPYYPSNMVVMPICCHHYSSQCPTGTVLPPMTTQIYTRSESIV